MEKVASEMQGNDFAPFLRAKVPNAQPQAVPAWPRSTRASTKELQNNFNDFPSNFRGGHFNFWAKFASKSLKSPKNSPMKLKANFPGRKNAIFPHLFCAIQLVFELFYCHDSGYLSVGESGVGNDRLARPCRVNFWRDEDACAILLKFLGKFSL